MSDSGLVPNSMAEPEERQAPAPRKAVIHGSVSDEEYQEVDKAIDAAGFRSHSEGVRTIGLLFARLPALRELVRLHRQLAA